MHSPDTQHLIFQLNVCNCVYKTAFGKCGHICILCGDHHVQALAFFVDNNNSMKAMPTKYAA